MADIKTVGEDQMAEKSEKEHYTAKERITKICYELIRFSEKIFNVFRIRQNRIMFQSYGHAVGYTCNPKYICEYLKANYPGEFELVWAFGDPGAYKNTEGIKAIKHKSFKWLYYLYTSKVIVLNEGPYAYAAKRKGQYLIQTWHGGGAYKKVGLARDDISPLSKWVYETAGRDIDLFLAASEVSARTSAFETFHYAGEIMKSGTPRNDLLLDPSGREKTAQAVRDKLALNNAYVVLYAPTFRNTDENLHDVFSFKELEEALKQKLGREVVFLIRAHRYHDGAYKTDINSTDVTDYPDMQELLCAADMLITDYSSSMWDFALLERPCLLYVPDLDQYEGDRGFFTPVSDWPGIICRTSDELYRTASTFDEAVCARKAEEHLEKLGSYETGDASRQVCERILQITGQDRQNIEQKEK